MHFRANFLRRTVRKALALLDHSDEAAAALPPATGTTPPISPEEEKRLASVRACWSNAQVLFFVLVTCPKVIDHHNQRFGTLIKYYRPYELERAWEVTKTIFESSRALIQASKDKERDTKVPNLGCGSIEAAIEVLNDPNPTLARQIYDDLWKMAASIENTYLPPHEFPEIRSIDEIAESHVIEDAKTERMGRLTGVSGAEGVHQCCTKMFREAISGRKSCSLEDSRLYGEPRVIALQYYALFCLDGAAADAWMSYGKKEELQAMAEFLPERAKRDLKADLFDYYKVPLDVSGSV